MMDWNPIPFEPNLKFALELSEDLQTKYFEQHEKAKQTLEKFSHSLQNIFTEHQKLLRDNLQLSLLNEKFKRIIHNNESSQPRISTIFNDPSSEILGASPNCKLDKLIKTKTSKTTNNKSYSQEIIEQKENINELVPIFSSDFNSDMEDETFGKCKSPLPSIPNTPEKVQNSPILSKRKRFNSKKNNSSLSNTSSHSITSSNDSKVSAANTPNVLEKNINEIEIESDKEADKETKRESKKEVKQELENEFKKEPLKTIENTFTSVTPKCTPKTKGYNMLSVSTTNFGRTEFADKGKKLRQTTLTLKKVIPVIDISKVDSQENSDSKKNDSKNKVDSSWSETFFENDNIYTKKRKKDNPDVLDIRKESVGGKNINQINQTWAKDVDDSMKDDELIETSPAQNEKSKLRNKLSLKKPEISKTEIKSPNVIKIETLSRFKEKSKSNTKLPKVKNKNDNDFQYAENNNVLKPSTSKESNVKSFNAAAIKGKSFELQRSLSDDTYFSPAELADNRNDLKDDEMDITEFEDEIKSKTPPAKRMLLDSYDMVPGRYEKSPDFAYKEGAIRNKNERAQLQGWCCRDCQGWYQHLPLEEQKKRMNECSRHRGRHNVNPPSPESLWNPDFDESYKSTCE
ncbi:hypothetical protein TSAR_013783 [Trichomalopsis sarcophagae]|uniref:DNA endonuclease activator Ctp1 C-terminal domain-containing protein n=1 Tax=Trichomalopsis sarcophagae TaxID=543379 RepID=A0A232F3C6_9HYME|nr:hypothetical protein TSAR_013783 [Trichomalopsis sarcophagae]